MTGNNFVFPKMMWYLTRFIIPVMLVLCLFWLYVKCFCLFADKFLIAKMICSLNWVDGVFLVASYALVKLLSPLFRFDTIVKRVLVTFLVYSISFAFFAFPFWFSSFFQTFGENVFLHISIIILGIGIYIRQIYKTTYITTPVKKTSMRQYFPLNAKEKKQEWLLLLFAVLSFIIIGKGVYNQYHQIDQDNILIPLLTAMYTCLLFVYGFNALTTGNLIPKWTPLFIYQLIYMLTKKISSITNYRAKIIAKRILGTIALVVSLGFFVATIFIMAGNK